AASLAVSALLGCSSSPAPDSQPSLSSIGAKIDVVPAKVEVPPKDAVHPGIGKYGGTLTAGLISDPKTFNIVLAQETSSTTPLSFISESLAETNSVTGRIQPDLAAKWVVSRDSRTYTFTLRKGLKWSDGAPLTADDVDFTFNKVIYNPKIPTDLRDVITVAGQLPVVKELDPLHVQVMTAKPFAPFLRSFATIPILPKHALAGSLKLGRDGQPIFNRTWTVSTDITKIPSNGPFMFADYVPGQRIVFKRNPYYFRVDPKGHRLPYLDRVVLLIVKDQNAGVLKFQSGETDMMFVDAPLRGEDFAEMVQQEKAGNFTIYKAGPDFGTFFLTFNQNVGKDPSGKPYVNPIHEKWFRDARFRQALAHAIDKQSIIRNVFRGIAIPQIAAESQTSPFYNDKVPTYDYNLAEAQELLAQAGYKKDASGILRDAQGNAVTFTLNTNAENNERMAIAQILMDDFHRLGIQIQFQPLTFNTLVQKTSTSLDWEAVLMGFTGSLDPALGANIWVSKSRLHMFNQFLPNMQGWQAQSWEKQIDKLFAEGATTLDEAKRKEIYDQYQVVAAQELPYIYIVNQIQLFPVRNVFGNLDVTPIGGPAWNIFSLYRTDLK
ncbi:MAG: ABC transporter substrate-binding protein, partial [Cyanobacteria bacterium REEB65]|nr:ABC transporter substrate-binding protein [Cyanobacteria bacterium REEB65]